MELIKCDPDETIELTPLQVEVLLLSATQDAEKYEKEHSLKPPHKTPASRPEMSAVRRP